VVHRLTDSTPASETHVYHRTGFDFSEASAILSPRNIQFAWQKHRMAFKALLPVSLVFVLCASSGGGPYLMKNAATGEQVTCTNSACVSSCLAAGFAGDDADMERDVMSENKGRLYIQLKHAKPGQADKIVAQLNAKPGEADKVIAQLTRDSCLKSASHALPP
jgi:hypothetical protein